MKTSFRIKMTFISIFLLINVIQVKAVQIRLDQIQLLKQLTGSWRAEMGKDTLVLWDIKSTGTGLDCSYRYMTGGKIIFEGKQKWEYDRKTDKNTGTQAVSGKDEPIGLLWFTAKNRYVIVSYTDNAKPENISYKIEGEFKGPDTFIQTNIVNGKPLNTYTFKRIR